MIDFGTMSFILALLVMAVSLNEACHHQGDFHTAILRLAECPTYSAIRTVLLKLEIYKFILYVTCFVSSWYFIWYFAMGMLDSLHFCLMFVVFLTMVPTIKHRLKIENRS